ncbi:polyhydroxyalkanoate synthesis repressor PhaR [Paucibacter sp. JuS9]|uniref:polyhydroxyalkanoate synthesis repressor PhaR n=1 Tax=Paucibacter sp. JuS9 TaxID=3228748 RepID=UPI003757F7D7
MATARRGKTKAEEGAAPAEPELRILKKYPNRRLYDTKTSSYITLADVKKMVLDGQAFEVRDAKTAEDLTRAILLQIILEEETGGVPMFTTQSLEQIIRFYGHAMQGVMGEYLEKNMQTFSEMQKKFVDQSPGLAFSPETWAKFMGTQSPMMQGLMGGMGGMGGYVEQGKNLLEQMTEQMQKAFPGMPGFPPKK